jgi:transcriptional regulator of arginine metabolism
MNRTKRLVEIRSLIKHNKIGSQEELLTMLNKNGYNYTQATLSRDLRLLKAGKIADDEKGQIYVLPGNEGVTNFNGSELKDTITRGILSIDYTGNMAVIKTLPGFASGIAYKIDGMRAFEIIGTIAGDDTILIIAREGIGRSDLHSLLTTAIPEAGIR